MATTKVQIVNLALDKLGASTILSFDDELEEARLARTDYDHLRDEVLEAHPWNFAMKLAALAADASSPLWGFDYRYQKPSDCLRVWMVEGEREDSHTDMRRWRVRENYIHTDLSPPLNIEYIFRQEVVARYSATFVEAFSARMAMEWVEPLVKNASLQDRMANLYAAKLQEARTADGQESTPVQLDSSTWILNR